MELPELHRRSQMLAAGFADDEVRRLVRVGELTPVRRGAYLRGPAPDDVVVRHVLQTRAAMEVLSHDAVVSHISAAVLHRLPIWAVRLDRVHVTRSRRTGGRSGARVHVHTAGLDPDEVVLIAGLKVTSLARTVIDLARTLPFEKSVVLADAALSLRRIDRVDRAALHTVLERARRWPGTPGARRVAAFADGRSESVGESRSRIAIVAAGLPDPVLQWEVRRSGDGGFIGRVDFGWPELCTVGEFDGLVKYGRVAGTDPADVLVEEKRREDALRAEGLAMVRWTWVDLADFTPVATRLRSRFGY
ncbi:type IV toxin-antitoxin system AbiEi family antitoxin domain-containing protein [Pseudonocardia sp. CA-142604]|uniref:type IV toxin-antitoxin system AbiEi family antitoxin domain-containing protein n=1 Tax=Pseudonocardia sp. CA-142604 TaxID=3240024 RepID=UPI003D91B689